MTNGKYNFEIEGAKYSLHFGMVATQIFAEKAAKQAIDKTTASSFKSFAYLVYAGLCNQAELQDTAYPTFEEAYELTELIAMQDESLQNEIYACWAESKPGKNMLDKLPKQPADKKKAVGIAKIGTK